MQLQNLTQQVMKRQRKNNQLIWFTLSDHYQNILRTDISKMKSQQQNNRQQDSHKQEMTVQGKEKVQRIVRNPLTMFRLQNKITKTKRSQYTQADVMQAFRAMRRIIGMNEKGELKLKQNGFMSSYKLQDWEPLFKFNVVYKVHYTLFVDRCHLKILQCIGFHCMRTLVISTTKLTTLEFVNHLDAPKLQELRFLGCEIVRIGGFKKAHFPQLRTLFLVQNYITDLGQLTRCKFRKDQNTQVFFLNRPEIQGPRVVNQMDNGSGEYHLLFRIENLDFIMKLEFQNVIRGSGYTLNDYRRVLINFYKFANIQQDFIGRTYCKSVLQLRPLVEQSVMKLAKRFHPNIFDEFIQYQKKLMQCCQKFGIQL